MKGKISKFLADAETARSMRAAMQGKLIHAAVIAQVAAKHEARSKRHSGK